MNMLLLMIASATRNLATMFPGYVQTSDKNRHWFDYGYPDSLTFSHFYTMYKRNGIARAGVVRPVEKTWQDSPFLLERDEVHDETNREREVREAFERLQFWNKLAILDEYGRVGAYSGLIFRFANGKTWDQPVERVNGLDALVEVIPTMQGQLKVVEFNTDERSIDYGKPVMFQFMESDVTGKNPGRNVSVHPDRVHVWSKDGTVHGESCLEAGYNHLVDIEKVLGAGGEGFWKNAKSAPIFDMDKDASPEALARMLGVEVDKLADKLDEVFTDFQKGFDQSFITQGMKAQNLQVNLPSPEEFYTGPIQAFAASIPIPMKVLVGSQTGERASTEDAKEWDAAIMSRRERFVIPNIRRIVERLVKYGVMANLNWVVDWSDLTEDSMAEKVDRALKMADMNAKSAGLGERYFTSDEVREVMNMEPGTDLGLDMADDVDDQDASQEPAANHRRGRVAFVVHRKAA